MTEQRTELYCGEGTSDKVYNLAIVKIDGRYQVAIEYGKRGSRLNEHSKPEEPTHAGEADQIYHELIKQKTRRGYSIVYSTNYPY